MTAFDFFLLEQKTVTRDGISEDVTVFFSMKVRTFLYTNVGDGIFKVLSNISNARRTTNFSPVVRVCDGIFCSSDGISKVLSFHAA